MIWEPNKVPLVATPPNGQGGFFHPTARLLRLP